MINYPFYPMSNKMLTKANNAARRLVNELNKIGETSPFAIRNAYYGFLELFSCFYINEYENIEDIEHYFYDITCFLRESIPSFQKGKKNYDCFWGVFITTNQDGNECSVGDFKRFLRTKLGERNSLTCRFNTIIEDLYPDYKDIPSKTYRFININKWGKDKERSILDITGRIPEKNLNEILEQFYNSYDAENIKFYLGFHHLEYTFFNISTDEISFDSCKRLAFDIDSYNFDIDFYNKHQKYLGNLKNNCDCLYIRIDISHQFEDDDDLEEYVFLYKNDYSLNKGKYVFQKLILSYDGDFGFLKIVNFDNKEEPNKKEDYFNLDEDDDDSYTSHIITNTHQIICQMDNFATIKELLELNKKLQ